MTTLRRALPVFLVVFVIAACSSSDDPTPRPAEGVSPPIPVAASVSIVELTANSLGAPVPSGGATAPLPSDPIEAGRTVSAQNACTACHTVDGTPLVGPSWKGLFGRTEEMTTGPRQTVDEAYITESIRNPGAHVVKGFPNTMPAFDFLSDAEIQALVAYIRSLE